VRTSSLRALFVGLAVLAAARGAGAEPPKKVIVLTSGCGVVQRMSALALRYARPVERVRPALRACHELALAEDPSTAAELTADVRVAPNGDVAGVLVTARGTAPGSLLTCVRRALSRAVFEPPEGGGASVVATLLLGTPPPAPRAGGLPLRAESNALRVVLAPIRLRAAVPPPAVRAVGAAVRATEACAAALGSEPKGAPEAKVVLDAHLLVGEAGELARVEASTTSGTGEALARCVSGTVGAAPRGRLSRVDVKLAVTKGEVQVAR
jgi:hypothetical protein